MRAVFKFFAEIHLRSWVSQSVSNRIKIILDSWACTWIYSSIGYRIPWIFRSIFPVREIHENTNSGSGTRSF